MNDKLKFYRSTLVQITKGLIGYTPKQNLVEDAGKITEEIMKKVDEFEQEKTNMWSQNYDPSYNTTTTIINHLGFEGNKQKVNPDYLKTEPMEIKDSVREEVLNKFIKTANVALHKKPYGTLGEHLKELMDLFKIKDNVDIKEYVDFYKIAQENGWRCNAAFQNGNLSSDEQHKNNLILNSIANSLGIEFIEDFIKSCEKCEE